MERLDSCGTSGRCPITAQRLSDEVVIEAAMGVCASSSEAESWHAWELTDSVRLGDLEVDLEVCIWDGVTVENVAHAARVQLEGDAADALTGAVLSDSVSCGSCVSNAMVESAVAFIGVYDRAWAMVSERPALVESELSPVTTEESHIAAVEELAQREGDGVSWQASVGSGVSYPEDLVQTALYRSVDDELEVILCVDMNPDFGLYRDDVLLDNFAREDRGPHAVSHYRISPGPRSRDGG